jgi:hypothetical protein
MTARNLRAVPKEPPEQPVDITRVIGITFRRNEWHEFRCIQAIRTRAHPAWSRNWSGFRVSERVVLEAVE